MRVKCYHVKLESLVSISDKCYKARSWDGREDLIPKSQVLDEDCDGYWISAWILEKKNIQYSSKKEAEFVNKGNYWQRLPKIEFKKHVPKKIEVKEAIIIEELIKEVS